MKAISIITALAASALSVPTIAATATTNVMVAPAAACEPMVPTNDVRYTASTIRNAGTANFFVTCALPGEFLASSTVGVSTVEIYFINRATSAKTVNCTLHAGWTGSGTSTTPDQGTFPKSINLSPGASGHINWNSTNVGLSERFELPRFTCSLAPNVELKHIYYPTSYNVGA